MNDETLREMHAIKDANGGRYPTMQALVKATTKRESESMRAGRRIISPPKRSRLAPRVGTRG